MNGQVLACGDRVLLRDAVPEDADAYVRWLQGGEWREYDAPWEWVRTKADTEQRKRGFVKRHITDLPFPRTRAIIATKDNRPIGWLNSYSEERFPATRLVGIDICEDDCLNQGFGTEALRHWVGYLFSHFDVHRIALHTYSFNPRMIRVAEKVGFIREGADREIIQWQGRWVDRVRFSLLRREWGRR